MRRFLAGFSLSGVAALVAYPPVQVDAVDVFWTVGLIGFCGMLGILSLIDAIAQAVKK